MCHTHSDIGVRQMVQAKWQGLNSFGKPVRSAKHNKPWRRKHSIPDFFSTFCEIHDTFLSNSNHIDQLVRALLPVWAECVFEALVWEAVGGGHRERQIPGLLQGGWPAGRQAQNARSWGRKARCKYSTAAQRLRFLLNSRVLYFAAPGFIAPLLREWEPRRLFNIISSSQYIIPQQILVYLQTRLKYMERDEEWEQRRLVEEEGGTMAVATVCESNSLTQRERERERRLSKSHCVSHHGVKLIQWQTPDGGPSPEVPCVSLSHKARYSASAVLCHSLRRTWSRHIWPPCCLSLVPPLRPAGLSQVLQRNWDGVKRHTYSAIHHPAPVPHILLVTTTFAQNEGNTLLSNAKEYWFKFTVSTLNVYFLLISRAYMG